MNARSEGFIHFFVQFLVHFAKDDYYMDEEIHTISNFSNIINIIHT